MNRLYTADAAKVSPREFFDAVFPRRTPEEQAEGARLAREHQHAIQASYKLPLAEGIEERARLNAEFDALVKSGKTEVMILTDSLDEQVARDLKFTIELQRAIPSGRAVAASQSRRVSPSRPSGLPSLSQGRG